MKELLQTHCVAHTHTHVQVSHATGCVMHTQGTLHLLGAAALLARLSALGAGRPPWTLYHNPHSTLQGLPCTHPQPAPPRGYFFFFGGMASTAFGVYGGPLARAGGQRYGVGVCWWAWCGGCRCLGTGDAGGPGAGAGSVGRDAGWDQWTGWLSRQGRGSWRAVCLEGLPRSTSQMESAAAQAVSLEGLPRSTFRYFSSCVS